MNDLTKIKDITSEYNISARTLRYYEEIGLIESTRSDDYAYRMYDKDSINRLQKILILRRLNVSIKDIKRIFNAPGSDNVLEVLAKKANNIDGEVSALLELSGNSSNVRRLNEISETLKKLPDVRIYEIPPCKMVASQMGMFGDGKLEEFDSWFSQFPRGIFPKDYLTSGKDGKGFVWMYIYHEGMEVPDSFDIIDYSGGLYAVTSGIDADDTDYANAHKAIYNFIEEKECFELDLSRTELGNVITPPSAKAAMKYEQMNYWVPIKVKREINQ